MTTRSAKPGILFTMRYPDDTGYVWNYIAGVRDRASGHLRERATPYMAFPKLTGNPSYQPQHVQPIELDCYDNSAAGQEAIAAFVRQHAIKVVIFMSALPQTICLDRLRELGVRTINTEDNGFDPLQRDSFAKRGMKFLLRRVLGRQSHDLHLANSESQRQFLLNYALLPAHKVVLMKNSVDCGHFRPSDRAVARARTGLDADRFWIIAVSQARPEKRVEQLLHMLAAVVRARSGVKIGFVYVGDGPPVAGYQHLAQELGLDDVCRFAGRQNDVRPYYHAADLMVHGAAVESFGLAIVEAMACGIPVIASAAPGPRETIVDGKTGALIPNDDFDCFADTVLRYIDDKEMTRAHGSNARAHVDASYNVVRHGKEFAEHIERFLQ